jgi:hypothetical protein
MNSDLNANRGGPDWAKDYEEHFGNRLTFSNFDKGTKIRIYWHTTGEWWLGEIASYHPSRGHEIVYEEGSGENRQFSKQTIADMNKHVYKVLRKRRPQTPPANPTTRSAAAAAAVASKPAGHQDEDLLGGNDDYPPIATSPRSANSRPSVHQANDHQFALTQDEHDLLRTFEASLQSSSSSQSPSSASSSEQAQL